MSEIQEKIGFSITDNLTVGDGAPLLIMAGPCALEDIAICREIAETMAACCARHHLNYVFKGSYDKANRTSVNSPRGPGRAKGLEILKTIREQFKVPVLTDIHEPGEAAEVAAVVDILQIPAFLCRQTDLLLAAAATGRVVNVKKGQFLAPGDMTQVHAKLQAGGARRIMLTERGATFGYGNLVVDMRALPIMRQIGAPVVFDATHAVQLPGGQGTSSGGQREFVFPLARAAAAVGIDALFLEVHPDPSQALSDGPNCLPLSEIDTILGKIKEIHELVQR